MMAETQPGLPSKAKRKRRVPQLYRCLGIVLESLKGQEVTVELRNNNEISGIVDECDCNMNLTLLNAVRKNIRACNVVHEDSERDDDEGHELQATFIKGTSIRYVHLPDKLNMRNQVSHRLQVLERIAKSGKGHKIHDRAPKRQRVADEETSADAVRLPCDALSLNSS